MVAADTPDETGLPYSAVLRVIHRRTAGHRPRDMPRGMADAVARPSVGIEPRGPGRGRPRPVHVRSTGPELSGELGLGLGKDPARSMSALQGSPPAPVAGHTGRLGSGP